MTESWEELSIPRLSCFKENKLKLNLEKYHLIVVSGTKNTKIKLNLKKEKLLGIIFDDRLKLQYHIENEFKVKRIDS